MIVFNSVELIFEFPYRRVVSVHLLVGIALVFVELIDDECGVTVHHEVFDAKLHVYTESMQCHLILCGIVGCPKVDPKDVAKLVPGWRYEIYTCPMPLRLRDPSKYMVQCLGWSTGT